MKYDLNVLLNLSNVFDILSAVGVSFQNCIPYSIDLDQLASHVTTDQNSQLLFIHMRLKWSI